MELGSPNPGIMLSNPSPLLWRAVGNHKRIPTVPVNVLCVGPPHPGDCWHTGQSSVRPVRASAQRSQKKWSRLARGPWWLSRPSLTLYQTHYSTILLTCQALYGIMFNERCIF